MKSFVQLQDQSYLVVHTEYIHLPFLVLDFMFFTATRVCRPSRSYLHAGTQLHDVTCIDYKFGAKFRAYASPADIYDRFIN